MVRSAVRVALAALLLLIAAPPASASPVQLWAVQIAGAPYDLRGMVLAADGSHHAIFARYDMVGAGAYATDRGGSWHTQALPVEPLAIVMDASDNPVVLGIDSLHHQIYRGDGLGSLAATQVPDTSGGRVADIKATADGLVHAAWSDGTSAYYATLKGTTWSSVTTLAPTGRPKMSRLALAVDGASVPHVIVSGAEGVACPAGGCVSDMAVTASPTAVDTHLPAGSIAAVTGPAGSVEVTGLSTGVLRHASNASAAWAAEVVTTGLPNALVSLATWSGATVLFFADGTNVDRADWSAGAWHLTAVHSGYDGLGAIDAQGVVHVAYTVPLGGADSATYIAAPDRTPPVATAPIVRPRVGGVVGTTVPVTVIWGGSDGLSGWATSTLRQRINAAGWSTIGTGLSAKSLNRILVAGATKYTFQVRGVDKAGNAEPSFVTGPSVSVGVTQQTTTAIHYSGTWHAASSARYLRGSAKYATASTASAKITVTGRGFAWVGAYGASRGSARVYVDGILAATVSTYRTSTTYRPIIWSIAWSTSGTHIILIRPVGTGSHPRIDLDAVVVVR